MTTRQNILANIQSTLEALPSIKKVLMNKLSIPDLNTYPTPLCFVFSGNEIKEWDVISLESWRWTVFIEIWARDTDMEDYLGIIHNAMAVDDTRGGYALKCERIGATPPWLIDPDDSLSAITLEYDIQYRHVEGTA